MQIINNHPCYLHHPKKPDHTHQMTHVLRAVRLFGGHTKKEIQKLATLSFQKATYMSGVYYPSYTFTELCRNGYISKVSFRDLKAKKTLWVYDITQRGIDFLLKADANDLKWIEDVHRRH